MSKLKIGDKVEFIDSCDRDDIGRQGIVKKFSTDIYGGKCVDVDMGEDGVWLTYERQLQKIN